ncbi:hypothetical protein [Alienimonas chondri]|uniref:DUF1592 domain-containing protein n=1 Tax=Alienimonas chondri TaxID=2681879 RepID=A0ABX1VCW3_9PLAN|nr:hypothetical protein [Alienimonas chondri]NNJ25549.1 hypothetical protein [Alienimonas chondri]
MRRSIALPLLAVALCVGCDPPQDYRAETELRADGTVARMVQQQNLEGTEGEWDGVRSAEVTDADDWMDPLASVKSGGPAMLAWGDFADAESLPDHIVESDGEPIRVAEPPIVTDHGVLKVFEWKETVRPGRVYMAAEEARAALVSEWINQKEALLAEALPPNTDAGPIFQWLRTRGDAYAAELFAIWIAAIEPRAEEGAADSTQGSVELEAANDLFFRLYTELGVDWPEEGIAGLADGEEAARRRFRQRVETFVADRVTVDGGKPADPDTVRLVLSLLDADAMTTDADSTPPVTAEDRAIAEERAAVSLYGSVTARDERMGDLGGQLTLSLILIQWNNTEFAYRHKMPGVLLETNGTPLSGGTASAAETLFRFDRSDAFPDGREMTATSALIDEEAQRKLLGSVPVRSKSEVETFLELVADPAAGAVWAECLEQESVEPLRNRHTGAAGHLRELLLGPGGAVGDDPVAAG